MRLPAPRHVTFDVVRPERFSRGGVPLRIVVLALFFVPGSLNWIASLFYLPVTTAVLVRHKGAEEFFAEDRRRLAELVHWIVGIYGYFAYLTDHLSLDTPSETIRFELQPSGTPTPRSALARIVTSIPNVAAFGLVGIAALGVWLAAGASILVTGNYPGALYAYQRGVNRWQARLFAYHTSLVDEYPSFRLETGREA